MLIPKRFFAISAVCSKDATRPNLAAVFAEREPSGSPRLTATNGHALLTVTWHEPDHQEFPDIPGVQAERREGFTVLVPATAWNEAGKVLSATRSAHPCARYALLHEDRTGERLRLTSTDGDTHRTIAARSPEESFPDYRILFPASDPVRVRIGLNAGLLASLLNTIDTLAGRNIGVEFLVPADAESPVELRVRGDDDEEIRALCMPVRLGRNSSAENRVQEVQVLLSQLDRLVSTEEFHRSEDLQTMVTEALAQLTATVTAAAASRPMTCERCQQPTTRIGDCGYCRDCCAAWCTHTSCACFGEERGMEVATPSAEQLT
jgi:hypothetical protein